MKLTHAQRGYLVALRDRMKWRDGRLTAGTLAMRHDLFRRNLIACWTQDDGSSRWSITQAGLAALAPQPRKPRSRERRPSK